MLSLRTNLLGAAFVMLAGAALPGPALAQSTPGQFTPDEAAPIQLHMPLHLRAPAAHKPAPKHKAAKPAAAVASAPAAAPPASDAQAAPIPFGTSTPPASTASPPPKAAKRESAIAKPASAPPRRAATRAERRKAVQEVLSTSASATPSFGAAADVSASGATVPFSFEGSTVAAPPPPPKPAPKMQPRPTAPPHASGPRPRTDVASLEPAPKQIAEPTKPPTDPHAGLTKKGEIPFASGSTDPEAENSEKVKAIAGDLNSALDAANARVELEAFGGPPGDRSSDARRLSLRRALAIRQLLIDSGIPATRIDVRALGGADDHGNPDRVDLYLRGAS